MCFVNTYIYIIYTKFDVCQSGGTMWGASIVVNIEEIEYNTTIEICD